MAIVLAGTWLQPCFTWGQSLALIEAGTAPPRASTDPACCNESVSGKSVRAALGRVCLRERKNKESVSARKAIVIGFVGGFVSRDDIKHPEVQFAEVLRQAYPSTAHVEVFSNHDGKGALRRVLQLLDANNDGVLQDCEKQRAAIVVYGHSWGASQTVTLARQLERLQIPVLLTVQLDSVHKPGHKDAVIPSNVRNAVNFFQTNGVIHGRSQMSAEDPERTHIIGNFQMSYQGRRIDCNNYPWIARHLNRGHHQIENDPLVWEQVAFMIDLELTKSTSADETSAPPASSPREESATLTSVKK